VPGDPLAQRERHAVGMVDVEPDERVPHHLGEQHLDLGVGLGEPGLDLGLDGGHLRCLL